MMSPNDGPELKWFASTMEALQYVRQHQEEHNARGFATVFCKSLGSDNMPDETQKPQVSNDNEEPSRNNAGSVWLEQAGPDQAAGQAENQQTENRFLVQPSRVELADATAINPFDGSEQFCSPNYSRSEASADLGAEETDTINNNDDVQSPSKSCPDTPDVPRGKATKGKTDIQRVSQYFHLPINDAAKELGMCLTVLKKICRKHGLKRWPHRKLKSIDKILDSLHKSFLNENGEEISVVGGDHSSAYDLIAGTAEKLGVSAKPFMPTMSIHI